MDNENEEEIMKKQEEERNKRLVAQPSSLLILELINSFDFYYSVVYLLVIFFLFVFKRILFEYEFWLFIIEIIVSGVMILINFLRLKLISIGNKTEKSLMVSIIVSQGTVDIPAVLISSLICLIFLYLLLQCIVLRGTLAAVDQSKLDECLCV